MPAGGAGTQGYFLRSNGWAEGNTSSYFLCKNGQWKQGNSNDLFLRGDASWANMQLGIPLSTLNLGDLVKFGKYLDTDIQWIVVDSGHAGFPDNSVTLVSKFILTLKSFDGIESTNPNSHRSRYGNNDYTVSNIRQWLNSSAPAGSWYSPQHDYDAPPNSSNVWGGYNPYSDSPGFLTGFSNREISIIQNTTRQLSTNGSNATSCVDKVFLPTTNELGLQSVANNGSKFAAASTPGFSLIAYPTQQAVVESTYKTGIGANTACQYLTATSYPSTTYRLQYVYTNGQLRDVSVEGYRSFMGVRPAINLPGPTPITPEKDSDGCYIVL